MRRCAGAGTARGPGWRRACSAASPRARSSGGALAGPRYAEPADGVDGVDGSYADEGCPLVRQPVYDAAGRFAGYRAVPAC